MKFSDIKTFKDFLASFFVLKFEPEDKDFLAGLGILKKSLKKKGK